METIPMNTNIYYQLFNQNNDAIFIIHHTDILQWNEKAEHLFGLSKNETYSVGSISPEKQPDGQPSREKALYFIQCVEDENVCIFNWLHMNLQSQQTFTAEVHLVKLKGSISHLYMATVRDITHRLKAEQDIYNAKLKYELIIENANDIIEIITPQGLPLFISGQVERILGYPVYEAMTHVVFERIHPEDIEAVYHAMSDGLTCYGAKKTVEYRYKHKLGHYVYLEATGCNLIHEPAISGLFLTIKDIDERKRYETILLEAKKTAEAANESKSTFLANMSHEIRTPLTAIIGSCDLLLDTALSEDQETYLGFINTSSKHLKAIVDDVLDFSKIEANMLELDCVWFALDALIIDVLDFFKIAAESKGITLGINKPTHLPTFIYADPLRLKQIIINLLGNAIKFTEQGQVLLKVSFTRRHKNMGKIIFSIVDTGIGIEENTQKILFKAFTQADSSTTRKFGGTGLGLIISELLANKMNSHIEMTSVKGQGSTFFFELVVPTSGNQVHTLDTASPEVQAHCKDIRTILIADDMDINRVLLLKMLRKICPEVDIIEAKNGQEAYSSYTRSLPELIFMDLQMPGTDGFLATENIRAYEQENHHKPCFIIGLTASILEEDKLRSFQAGMNEYLTKPFDANDLLNIIKNV